MDKPYEKALTVDERRAIDSAEAKKREQAQTRGKLMFDVCFNPRELTMHRFEVDVPDSLSPQQTVPMQWTDHRPGDRYSMTVIANAATGEWESIILKRHRFTTAH